MLIVKIKTNKPRLDSFKLSIPSSLKKTQPGKKKTTNDKIKTISDILLLNKFRTKIDDEQATKKISKNFDKDEILNLNL